MSLSPHPQSGDNKVSTSKGDWINESNVIKLLTQGLADSKLSANNSCYFSSLYEMTPLNSETLQESFKGFFFLILKNKKKIKLLTSHPL